MPSYPRCSGSGCSSSRRPTKFARERTRIVRAMICRFSVRSSQRCGRPRGEKRVFEEWVAEGQNEEAGMAGREPTAELDARYGDADTPTSWADALRRFEQAQVYWVVTVRTEGGPHVTPLFGVELDGALYFFTGPTEQKARNLAANPRCALLNGCNTIDELDVVVEGKAVRVRDEATLRRRVLAQAGALSEGARARSGSAFWLGGAAA